MANSNFMRAAIDAAFEGMNKNDGGPFGAIVVKDNNIIAMGHNMVGVWNDPTAHAEIIAIRKACEYLKQFELKGCDLYTSCEPCPMCLGAVYWAKLHKVYYGCNTKDAARAGFDDQFIYREIKQIIDNRTIPFIQIMQNESLKVFEEWLKKEDKPNL